MASIPIRRSFVFFLQPDGGGGRVIIELTSRKSNLSQPFARQELSHIWCTRRSSQRRNASNSTIRDILRTRSRNGSYSRFWRCRDL
ncbi:hypothetical protein TMEN_7786 [Trichophyton mentagrophytes]|nr:hypothetical protein TMEN_7786 [Trichophyton mentagrophytes]